MCSVFMRVLLCLGLLLLVPVLFVRLRARSATSSGASRAEVSLPSREHCSCASMQQNPVTFASTCTFLLPRSKLIHQPPIFPQQLLPCIANESYFLLPGAKYENIPVRDGIPSVQVEFSIIMNVWNRGKMAEKALELLLPLTTETWELIVVFDDCRDNSIALVSNVLKRSTLPSNLRHYLLIDQQSPVLETTSNNIGMRAASPATKYFILLHEDQWLRWRGWNTLMALPARLYTDVFAVSSRCAHGLPPDQGDYIGRCDGSSPEKLNAPVDTLCAFHVRGTVNRGPLLLDANRTAELGYLDEVYFSLGEDDHNLMSRAWNQKRWVVGWMPMDFEMNAKRFGDAISSEAMSRSAATKRIREAISANANREKPLFRRHAVRDDLVMTAVFKFEGCLQQKEQWWLDLNQNDMASRGSLVNISKLLPLNQPDQRPQVVNTIRKPQDAPASLPNTSRNGLPVFFNKTSQARSNEARSTKASPLKKPFDWGATNAVFDSKLSYYRNELPTFVNKTSVAWVTGRSVSYPWLTLLATEDAFTHHTQQKIQEHQLTRNCNNKAFYFFKPRTAGIGSDFHVQSVTMALALNKGFLFLHENQMLHAPYVDTNRCPAHERSYDCYFVPPSLCKSYFMRKSRSNATKLIAFNDFTSRTDNYDQVSRIVDYDFYQYLVPDALVTLAQAVLDKGWYKTQHAFWRAQYFRYIFRPSRRTLIACRNFLKKHLVVLTPTADSYELVDIDSKSGAHPPLGCITLNVRHDDMSKESLLRINFPSRSIWMQQLR